MLLENSTIPVWYCTTYLMFYQFDGNPIIIAGSSKERLCSTQSKVSLVAVAVKGKVRDQNVDATYLCNLLRKSFPLHDECKNTLSHIAYIPQLN